MIDQTGIRRLLPHRFPMLLLDRVTDLVPGERITAVKAVTCNEPWFGRLGPDAAAEDYGYPSVLLTESWCQAAGLLAVWDPDGRDVLDGRLMLFGGVSDVEFLRPVLPGDVVEHRASVARTLGDTVIFEGDSAVEGETVMRIGRAVLAFRPAGQLRPGND
ncbi:3-hydroxyacyl-ACP dehydratase FabZ family protein [Streptomyces fildesensis]|uniref:3-hydroxyacyl-ACP dehydratase FabZ family protein n=1 Tax=Streptomyces fildesensis TaxID=375757 RepID=A0ABW8C383_9ACTN